MATLKDIANAAGVSVPTVSRVLNGHAADARISAKRASEIQKIATKFEYRPHAGARSMRAQRSQLIGVLIRNAADRPFTSPMNYESILGINQALEPAGFAMSLVRIHDVMPKHGESRLLREQALDGVIALGDVNERMELSDQSSRELFDRVENLTPRCLWLDSSVDRPVNCIRRDEFRAGEVIVERLHARGYQKIVYLAATGSFIEGTSEHYSSVQRRAGVVQTAQRLGLPCQIRPVSRGLAHRDTFVALGDMLHRDAALVAYDVASADRVMHELSMLGRAAGRDYGLACLDDSYYTSLTWPALTRVRVSRFHLGLLAGHMMLDLVLKGQEAVSSILKRPGLHRGRTANGPAGPGVSEVNVPRDRGSQS